MEIDADGSLVALDGGTVSLTIEWDPREATSADGTASNAENTQNTGSTGSTESIEP